MTNVHVLHEQELPMPAPQTVPPRDPNTFGQRAIDPSPPTPQNPQLPAVYQAIAAALVGRIHGLLLILSCIGIGIIVACWPSELRLYAGGGYAVFALIGLWMVRR